MWLFFLFALAFADTGLRVTLTQTGINKAKSELEPLVTEYIRSLEPLEIQTGSSNSDYVNITTIEILNTTHSGFNLSIVPGSGLEGVLLGFGARVNLGLFYRYPLGWTWYPLNDSNVTLTGANIAFHIELAADAKGKPNITFKCDSFTNVTIDVGDILSDGFIKNLVDDVAAYMVRRDAPDSLTSAVNDAIKHSIDENWNNGTLNLTDFGLNGTFDYRLIPPPNFTAEFLGISVEGHVTYNGIDCPGGYPELPPAAPVDDLELMVNMGLINCLLYQVKEAKVVEQVIHNAMEKANLTFDDRISLDLGLSEVPQVSFIDGYTTKASIGLRMNLGRNISSSLVRVIGLDMNASATVKTQLHLILHNSSADVDVLDVEVIGLSNSYLNTDMVPKRYVDQIQNEDWKGLMAKLNTFIHETLGSNFHFNVKIPNNYTDLLLRFVSDVSLSSGPTYLTIGADLAKNSLSPH